MYIIVNTFIEGSPFIERNQETGRPIWFERIEDAEYEVQDDPSGFVLKIPVELMIEIKNYNLPVLYRMKNIDGVVKEFYTDQHFMDFVKDIYRENEEGQPYPTNFHFLPEHIQNAKEYIVEYCQNWELEEL